MSSGSTIMLSAASSAGGSDDDDVECRIWYGVVVACVSLLLFCVLAATAGVVKACAVTGSAVVFFGVIGWLVPGGATAPRAATATGGDASRVVMALWRAGYSGRGRLVGAAAAAAAAIDVPPAFAYECPADAGGGSGGKAGGAALCAVCLEDVRRGETVRRLPACGHLFHKECIDMWLHSHATCPLCRRDLSPRRRTTKTVATAAQSSVDALPPV